MKRPEIPKVEVDMVPMIDLVVLLLMFLIVVGDTAATASAIEMKLPRADQALPDKSVNTENRLVIQLKPDGGKYRAVIGGRSYELVRQGNQTLDNYLERQVRYSLDNRLAIRNSDKSVSMPVKLRIPENAPMHNVELMIITLATHGLTNVQYAAMP